MVLFIFFLNNNSCGIAGANQNSVMLTLKTSVKQKIHKNYKVNTQEEGKREKTTKTYEGNVNKNHKNMKDHPKYIKE